ncbi:MAG: PAS domain S-box protein [Polyangiaceae bacterium]
MWPGLIGGDVAASPTSRFLPYGLAIGAVALSVWCRLLLNPVVGEKFPYATVFLAVLVTASYGGVRPSLLAVVLGGLGAGYFLIPARGLARDQEVGLVLYAFTGLGISVLGGRMHDARVRSEAYATSVARQAALIDQTHDAVLVWTWNGPITFWNKGAERLYGYPPGTAIGRVSHDLLRTTTANGMSALIDLLERRGSWEGELTHICCDGGTTVVESRMVLVQDPAGAYVLEANRDITARKKTDAALRKAYEKLEARVAERTAELAASEERLRGVLEGMPAGLIAVGGQGEIVLVNAVIEALFGYARSELLGKPIETLLPLPLRGQHAEHRTSFLAAPAARAMGRGRDLYGRRKDGSEIPLEIGLKPLELQGRRLVLGSVVDVSERKHAEAARSEAASVLTVFGLMIESINDYAIIRLDPQGRVVTWNSGARAIKGYEAAEIVGQPTATFYLPDEAANAARLLQSAGSSGRAEDEGWRVRKDGSRFWASVVITAFREPRTGALLGFVKVTRDLTERKRAADKTSAALAEKTALLREIHHRVKNNLQMIASLLKLQARRIDDDRARAMIHEARGRVHSIALLHESLYQSDDLGRIDMREYLGRFVSYVRQTYRPCPRIAVSAVDVCLPVDVAVPCGLIINELVTNALKYAFRDFADSSHAEIRVSFSRTDATFTLSVADNGSGFGGDVDPDVDKTMGLSLVRDLSVQLGGRAEFGHADGGERGVQCTVTFVRGHGGAES